MLFENFIQRARHFRNSKSRRLFKKQLGCNVGSGLNLRNRLRRLFVEPLEKRQMLNVDWRNPVDSLDVDKDGFTSPLDVLTVINFINANSNTSLPPTYEPSQPYLDVDGDQAASPLDVLTLINFINSHGTGLRTLRESSTGLSQESDLFITLGQSSGSRQYKLKLESSFDTSDTSSLNEDLLAIYLVDPSHPETTILDRGRPGTALFTWNGLKAEFATGRVQWDGSVLTIDLSDLGQQYTGNLKVQLLNQDRDSQSFVSIVPISNRVDSSLVSIPLPTSRSIGFDPGGSLDTAALTPNNSLQAEVENVRYSESTGFYEAEVRVINNAIAIGRNVAMVLPSLPSGVTLANASGTTSTGIPYINFKSSISRGGLSANGRSELVTLKIADPRRIPFRLQPSFLSSTNHAPTLSNFTPINMMPGNAFRLAINAQDSDQDQLAFDVASDGTLPPTKVTSDGFLEFQPRPSDIGSYTLNVIASDGAISVSRPLTVNVIDDSITTTRVSGRVINVDGSPITNMRVEIGNVQGLTQSDGSFLLDLGSGTVASDTVKVRGDLFNSGSIRYPFIAEKIAFLLGHKLDQHLNNGIIRPIYLPAIDSANSHPIDPTHDTTLTTNAIPGASLMIKAGSLVDLLGTPYVGRLSITEVPVGLTPAALPSNLRPDLVVTIQPGDMVFATPAPMTFPNRSGYPPGAPLNLWAVNPTIGEFEIVGTMVVSADGKTIETVTGGARYSSWSFAAPPVDQSSPGPESYESHPECDNPKKTCPINSTVENYTGAVTETHELVGYQSQGEIHSLTLVYDSLRADPRPIVHFRYENVSSVENKRLVAGASISRENYSKVLSSYYNDGVQLKADNFWSIPASGGTVDAALQFDMRSNSTGVYDYQVNSGLLNLYKSRRGFFDLEVVDTAGTTSQKNGSIVHVNSIDSPFGAGWGLAGLQYLVVDKSGETVLLVDGDGSELLFGSGLTSPPGDFSLLALRPDGTYTRTMKDKTVYAFDTSNRLATVTDRNSNRTIYSYNGAGLLSSITDPVGLQTTFTYSNGHLLSIKDPANRVTQFSSDSSGDLTQIADPDLSTRHWAYDGNHHQVVEIDKLGNREETYFDFAGRARGSRRADGTEIKITPAEVRGLYPDTSDPNNAPTAISVGEAVSQYTTASGNTTTSFLNRFGQAISEADSLGQLPKDDYNQDNQVTTHRDGRGNISLSKFDANGNLTSVEDSISNTDQIANEFVKPGDVHIYKFQGVAGTRLLASRLITTSGSEIFSLYAPDGRLLDRYFLNSNPGGYTPPVILPIDGEYRIEGTIPFGIDVSAGHPLVSSYRFRLLFEADASLLNNSSPTTNFDLDGNETKLFKFQGIAGQRTVVRKAALDSRVYLYGMSRGEYRLSDFDPVTLTEAGTYIVVVVNSSDQKLSESLFVESSLPENAPLAGLDIVHEGMLAASESTSVTFSGPAGHVVALDASGENSVSIQIQDVFGQAVPFSGTILVLPRSGEYFVKLQNFDAIAAHPFRFQMLDMQSAARELRDGATKPVTLDVGRQTYFWFDGNIEDRVFIDAPNLQTYFTTASDRFVDLVGDIGVLPTSGRYYVVVYNNGQATQTSVIKKKRVDTTLLPEGTGVTGVVAGDGTPIVYRFEGSKGDRFRYQNLGSAAGGRWYVLGPNEEPVYATSSYPIGNPLTDSNVAYLVTTGLHTLILTTHNTASSGTDLPYNIEWLKQTVETKPMSFGEVVTGTIDRPDDKDEFTLALQAGQHIYFDGLSQVSNLKVWIYSPSGVPLMLNYGYYSPGPYDDVHSLPILETGNYRVSIYGDWGDGFTGSYAFRILDVASTHVLAINGTTSDVLRPDKRAIPFTFSGLAGQKLNFHITTSSGNPGFNLYDPQDKAVPMGDNIPVLLTSTGRYMLTNLGELRPEDPSMTISITVTDVTDPPLSNSGLNNLQSGTLAPGEFKNFQFTAAAGTRILFDNHNLDSPGILVTVFDSSHTPIIENRIGSNNFNWSQLSKAGTYSVEIRGESSESTGDFEFRLLDIDAAATAIDMDQIVQGSFAANKTGVQLYKFVTLPNQSFIVDQYETGWTKGLWSPIGFQTGSIPTTSYAGTHILYLFANGNAIESFKFRVINLNAIPELVEGEISQGVAQPGEAMVWRADLIQGQRITYEIFNSQLVSVLDRFGRQLGRSVEANEFVAPETSSYFFIRDFDDIRNLFPYKFRLSHPASNTLPVDGSGGTSHAPKLEYDPTYNLLAKSVDPLGKTTLFERDSRGNLSKLTQVVGQLGDTDDVTTSITVTSAGLPDIITDSRGAISDFEYDPKGRLTTILRAKGTSIQTNTSYEYDTAGNVQSTLDGFNNHTTYRYDAMNRLIESVSPDPDGTGPLQSLKTQYAYDASGNLTQITDPLGHTQKFVFDAMHRMIESMDAAGKRTTLQYDKLGNLVRITDALGNGTNMEYDVRNRMVSQTDSNGNRTRILYDLDNNPIAMIDALGNKTVTTYDARNRITNRTDSLGGSDRFEYDPADQLTKQIDRLGRATLYTYDSLGRNIVENWLSPTSSIVNEIESNYDSTGNLIQIKDKFDNIQFEYDLLGQRIHTRSGGLNGVPASELIESFDLNGNRLTISDKIGGLDGAVKTVTYDAINRAVKMVEQGSQVASKRVDLGYDAGGRLASLRRFRDIAGSQMVATTTYSLDNLDQVTQIAHINSASAAIDTYTYQFDAIGQTTQSTDSSGSATYRFDKVGELVGATYTQSTRQVESYQFDALGNRTSSSLHGNAYVIDKDNRLTSNGSLDYSYDAEGNVVQSVNKQTGTVRLFEYDHRNRLISVADQPNAGSQPSQIITFEYDPLDRRIVMKHDTSPSDAQDGQATYFFYDGTDVIAEWKDADGNGPANPSPSMRYLHGPDVDQVLSQESAGGSLQWFLNDQLGSVRIIVDSQGQVLNKLTYDSFGNPISESNANVSTRYRFAGREFDKATGLSYNRARYYDASNGRFISQDPIKFAGGDANLYRYVSNNPIDDSDPSGLSAKSRGPKLNAIGTVIKATFEGAQRLAKWGKGIYKKGTDKISSVFGIVDTVQDNYDRAQDTLNELKLSEYQRQHAADKWDQLTDRVNEGDCPNPNELRFKRAQKATRVFTVPAGDAAHKFTDNSHIGTFLATKDKAVEAINKLRGKK